MNTATSKRSTRAPHQRSHTGLGGPLPLSMAIAVLVGSPACSQEQTVAEQKGVLRDADLEGGGNGTFRVLMHDGPYTGDIDAIDVTIERVELVPLEGEPLVVSTEAVAFDLLELTADNPMELVHADVPSGRYCQLRLVFSEDHTITVDGVEHPLETPSAEHSGFKLDGCFEITEGFLHSMTVDFSPDESIVHNQSNGIGKGKGQDKYLLEPKIEIVSNTLVTGTFAVTGLLGDETLSAELRADGSITMISTYDPRLVADGTYFFNYATSNLHIELGSVTCSSCAGVPSLPASVFYNLPPLDVEVTSWDDSHIEGSIDTGLVLDTPVVFDASDEMAIDATSGYTNLNIIVNYPSADWNGRTGVLSLQPDDEGRGFLDLQLIEGSTATFTFMVPYSLLPGGVPGGQADYRARLLVTDDVSQLSINAMSGGSVCGSLDLARDEYALTVPVADKTIFTVLDFVGID
jgi:hypothetical protein